MILNLPSTETAQYCSKFGTAAIYIGGMSDRAPPLCIGFAVDLRRALASAQARYPREFPEPPALLYAAWGLEASVRRVTGAVLRDLRARGNLVDIDVRTAVKVISLNAMRLNTRLSEHGRVMQKVEAAAGKIADGIESSRTNGALGAFNAEFKRRRLAAQNTGAAFMPYGAALSRLRRALASHIAATSSGEIPASMFKSVFGRD